MSFQLGDKVITEYVLTKDSNSKGVYWKSEQRTLKGVIVGKRTIRNTAMKDTEEGTRMKHVNIREAYLVAYALRRRPVYVLPDNLFMASE